MVDSYNELIVFAFICKTLSITEAAKELKKSKAHVSRQLSSLEKRIGTTLVYRTTRSLTLTENGLALKEDVLSLLHSSQQLDYKANSLSSGICGRFCITIPTSIATSFFSEVLYDLNKNFPCVLFNIIVSNEIENFHEKEIDLAIRVGKITDGDYIAHKVGFYREVLISSNKVEVGDDFSDLTFISSSCHDQHGMNIYLDGESININKFENVIHVNETATQLLFIKKGLGVGLAPSYMLSSSPNNNGVYNIFPNLRSEKIDVHVAYPYQTPLPEKLSKISMYLKKEIRKHLNQE